MSSFPRDPSRRLVRSGLASGALLLFALGGDVVGQAAPFQQKQYSTGFGPRAVAAGDLDGDGTLDLAVANQYGASVSRLRGNGTGGFLPATSHPTGSQPLSVVLADVHGDGRLDVVTGNSGSSSVSVLAGLAGGGLAAPVHLACGPLPQDVAAGDLDGDGDLDLVVAKDSLATPLTLLAGLGGGTFAPAATLASGFSASSVALSDVDHDGQLDVLVSDLSTDAVRLFLGGPGGLQPALSFPVFPDPRGLVAADLDGDGMVDVATAASGAAEVSVLMGAADSGLGPAEHFAVGVSPLEVATGDFDGDGVLDLLASNFGSGNLSLLRGEGGGAFGAPLALAAGLVPTGIAVADLDGDGFDDAAVANNFSQSVSVFLSVPPPWIDLGGGVAGLAGHVTLVGSGVPSPGETIVLTLEGASTRQPIAWLVAGLQLQAVPYKGGMLMPSLDLVVPIDPRRPLALRWPSSLPAKSSLYLQAWYLPHAPEGIATGTNGLRAIGQ